MSDKTAAPLDDELEGASLIERAAARLAAESRGPRGARTAAATSGTVGTELRPSRAEEGGASDVVRLDLDRLEQAGYLTPSRMRTRLAEEIRQVKRNVVQTFWYQEVERSNLIMVSSASPGEGKSFISLNLAISLACEVDFHVLLVDADFERPVVFDRLGIANEKGLMDLLKDESIDMSAIIKRTNIERLSLIGPGSRHDMSTELLASQRMLQITQEMADRYPDRLIIFDTPPLLACSEPAVLAELMGQAVLVVEADRTPREMIEKSLALVPGSCKVGIVLNKSRPGLGNEAYGYYGYKGYRQEDR